MKLTAKQQAFCEEYLVDLNATQAAIRAGYSPKTANVIGPENLAKPCIAECIAELKKARSKKTEINAAWVLAKSVILHNRCMVDGDDFSPSGAGKALDLIGKHIDVQAYSEKSVVVEMSHEEWLDSIK
jgi:phage terminase small subunit